MTDAAHMLSDLAGFLISLFAIWVGSRPPSSKMSFGWHRAGQLSKQLKRLFNFYTLAKINDLFALAFNQFSSYPLQPEKPGIQIKVYD